jgi:hypothetical protein
VPELLRRCGGKSRLRPRRGVLRCLVGVVLGVGDAGGKGGEAGCGRGFVEVGVDRGFRRLGLWSLC